MTKRCFCFTFFLLICFSLPLTATAQTVNIPDSNLRTIIAGALDKTSGEAITRADMARFLELPIPNSNIRNLTGLEYATNLRVLNLGAVRTTGGFRVNNNFITDISPLARLNNLEELNIEVSAISDISPLAGLNNLRWLFLDDNSISDVSPLEGLNHLELLALENNFIADISPLVANTGLGSGDRVWLEGNPLNAASINTHIPTLQDRGVTVESDAVVTEGVNIPDPNLRAAITTTLGKAPGTVITTADMANLTRLVALNDNISDLTGLEHATNLTQLGLGPERVQGVWTNSITLSLTFRRCRG